MRGKTCMLAALFTLALAMPSYGQQVPVPLEPVMVEYVEGAAGAVLQPTPPVATALNSIRWEHNTQDVSTSQVVRFELCYDTTTPCSVITPAAAQFTPTAAQGGPPATGNTAYKMLLPALTVGQHQVAIKACNSTDCGTATAPFVFRFAVVPGTPVGVGLIPGGGD